VALLELFVETKTTRLKGEGMTQDLKMPEKLVKKMEELVRLKEKFLNRAKWDKSWQVERYYQEECGFDEAVTILWPELARLRKQNEVMKEALEFYADRDSYGETRLYGGSEEPDVEFINDVYEDQGKEAKEALAQCQEKE